VATTDWATAATGWVTVDSGEALPAPAGGGLEPDSEDVVPESRSARATCAAVASHAMQPTSTAKAVRRAERPAVNSLLRDETAETKRRSHANMSADEESVKYISPSCAAHERSERPSGRWLDVRWSKSISRASPACEDPSMARLRVLPALCVLGLAAPAFASTSAAQLWTALGGRVTCGIAIHPANTPPMRLLCSARAVPPPKAMGVGDPGFVFLGSVGHPSRARLSQDSFVGTHAVILKSGRRWSVGPIGVTCTVSASAVRCENHSHHGFTITAERYHAF
jgi:hypothetical protein